ARRLVASRPRGGGSGRVDSDRGDARALAYQATPPPAQLLGKRQHRRRYAACRLQRDDREERMRGSAVRSWKQVRAGRGFPTVETVRRQLVRTFRWKDLRHTLASRLRTTGVELGTICDLLGHTTTRMTERYAHITPGHLHDAVQRISRTGTTTGTCDRVDDEPLRAVASNRAPGREKSECPRRDSNPRYRRERPTS